MLRILVCSEFDVRPELASTLVGRKGTELFRVERFEDARLLASTLDSRAILVDRDFPEVRAFVDKLRQDPATRPRSLAILARGSVQAIERQLVDAGANAVFRLPPDAGWDERLSKLMTVPARHDARMMVRIAVDTEPESAGAILNLSPGGMLLATQLLLHVGDEIGFRFKVPDGTTVTGRGRVAREAGPTEFGIQFSQLDDAGRQAIREFQRSARLG